MNGVAGVPFWKDVSWDKCWDDGTVTAQNFT